IMGTCGGGMAVMSSLSDFTFMESKNGKLFVNSPNTLDGNKSEDTAGVDFQSNETALVDFTGDEASIITEIRNLVSVLPSNNEDESLCECTDDLNRLCT
ncbi:carboxyl transferase, partial [Xanthomonas citri pv. citri]|nr:carboxyl transferase [Xanthomonas citri pv. citri]